MFEGCFEVLNDTSSQCSVTDIELSTSNCNGVHTTINMLPHEILAKIFDQIQLPTRNNLRETCMKWKTVMDSLVGTTIRIGTFSPFDPQYSESFDYYEPDAIPIFHSPTICSAVGIGELLVGNLSEDWEADHSWIEWFKQLMKRLRPLENPKPLPSFKSPGLVTRLCIFGKLSPPHFDHFLLQLPCIRVFSIAFYSLQHLHHSQMQNISFPYLEVLIIRSGLTGLRHFHQDIHGWDLRSILENTLALSDNHFPRLEYASIDFIYGIDDGLTITKTQLEFLLNHSTTIKGYSIEYSILMGDEFRLLPGDENHPELLPMINSLKSQIRLKKLIILSSVLPKLPFSSVWSTITEKQDILENFAILGVCYKLEFLQQLVDANYLTLITLLIWEIRLFDDETQTIKRLDCTIFNKCIYLRKLTLQGWTVSLNVKNVQNVAQLPDSLRHIDFRDMAITTSDIRILGLELLNLKTLQLTYVGNKREMGMDVMTLREIIEQRRLKQVRIVRSLNGKLNSDGIFNGDSSQPEQILDRAGGLIAFEIGPNGYYRNTDSFDSD